MLPFSRRSVRFRKEPIVPNARNQPFGKEPSEVVHLLSEHFRGANDCWRRLARKLYEDMCGLDDTSLLAEQPATKFVLAWMRELAEFQSSFGELFGRKKRPPAADDFTAAVGLSLVQFLATRGFDNRLFEMVVCEETTHREKNAKRPDISVKSFFRKELVATVECKTQVGWNRKDWKDEYEGRVSELRKDFPRSTPFLCVLTQANWNFSEFEIAPDYKKHWFCLSTVSPDRISDPVADSDVLCPIEEMFLAIFATLQDAYREDLQQMPEEIQQAIRDRFPTRS